MTTSQQGSNFFQSAAWGEREQEGATKRQRRPRSLNARRGRGAAAD